MADLQAALHEFLKLEQELILARIDEDDDFDDRWEAAESWFHDPQPSVIDGSPFFGDEEDRQYVAARDIYRLTTHSHADLGEVLVAHLSKPETDHNGYTSRIALAELEGTPQVVGAYVRCAECETAGCDYEDEDEGACQKTGWLHHEGVPHPATFGAATSTTDLAEPDDDWSRELLTKG